MIGRSSPSASPSSSSSVATSSLSIETVSSSFADIGSSRGGTENVRKSNGGNVVWKKPVEGEKEKVPVVMGASSWPALSNSSKKISSQQDLLLKSAVQTAITPESVQCLDSVSESLNNSSSDLVENNQLVPSSGKNLSVVSSSEKQAKTVHGDSTTLNSATTTTSNSGPNSDHKKTGGVGPRLGPPRPSRPYHHHRAHHYNPRHPPQQRGKESFNYDSNNNHSSNNNNHYSNSKRNQNRFHEFNSNRSKHFHTPFYPPQQGSSNGPHQFLMSRPPPPPPYTPPINFSYYNPSLPPPGYIFPYNYVSEHPYIADNSWQFTPPPFMDVNHMIRGVPPGNLHPPLTTQSLTPTINPQPQASPTNPQPQPSPVSSQLPLCNPQSQPPLVIPPAQFVEASQPELCRSLRSQIEYYFSDENLVKDTYLKGQMDEQGWVSVHLIAGFRRVKAMTEDISLILKALEPSTHIEVQGDKIRRGSRVVQYAADGFVSSSLPTETMLVTQLDNLVLDEGSRMELLGTQSSEHAKENPSATQNIF
ncbi:la-related protein 1C-like [Aristolochia californica]|uniref:la-related protein 1C-like n=1 Tax=Aristolochia californica TaxID=171875 RepID=UPI0035E24919